jgi:HEAT repeat protein
MKNLHILITVLVFSFSFVPLSGEEPEGPQDEAIKSLREERKATLLYGINKEVEGVILDLTEEKNDSLADEVFEVFKESYNADVLRKSLEYFIEIDYKKAVEHAAALLDDHANHGDDVIVQLITYLSHNETGTDIFEELSEHSSNEVARAAVTALGDSGTKDSASFLIELLENDAYPASIKPNIILALGELEAESAVETLESIVADETEDSIWRRYACDALGKIGAEESIDTLKVAASSDDPLLRSYAVYALSFFTGEEIEKFLIQALKDSYWQVREKAAEGLGSMAANAAVPILEYKAEHDPETKVRIAAINALSMIGGTKALGVLKELYLANRTSMAIRITALEAMLENSPVSAVEAVKKILQEEWEKENSQLLGNTCKVLVRTQHPALQPVFARLLEHHSYIVRIYALRGIQYNNFTGLRESVEKMTGEQEVMRVRKTAQSVLEEF